MGRLDLEAGYFLVRKKKGGEPAQLLGTLYAFEWPLFLVIQSVGPAASKTVTSVFFFTQEYTHDWIVASVSVENLMNITAR